MKRELNETWFDKHGECLACAGAGVLMFNHIKTATCPVCKDLFTEIPKSPTDDPFSPEFKAWEEEIFRITSYKEPLDSAQLSEEVERLRGIITHLAKVAEEYRKSMPHDVNMDTLTHEIIGYAKDVESKLDA